jgi:hypothetical protein
MYEVINVCTNDEALLRHEMQVAQQIYCCEQSPIKGPNSAQGAVYSITSLQNVKHTQRDYKYPSTSCTVLLLEGSPCRPPSLTRHRLHRDHACLTCPDLPPQNFHQKARALGWLTTAHPSCLIGLQMTPPEFFESKRERGMSLNKIPVS